MPGRFNVANALGALAGVARARGDPGRLWWRRSNEGCAFPGASSRWSEGQDFAVLVDYAHTPDSLENVLRRPANCWRGQPSPPGG